VVGARRDRPLRAWGCSLRRNRPDVEGNVAMTKAELYVALAAVLTTALETEPEFFPETMAYLALGSDMEKWQTVRSVLLQGGFATMQFNSITLTSKGRELAEKLNAVLVR
jgi:membrane associated rhomboid family serine protease